MSDWRQNVVWRIDDPMGNEARKIAWEIVKYTRGRGLDLGCGIAKTYQHWIGVDNCIDTQLFGAQIKPDVWVPTCERLDVFASQSMDFVFSSHLLEHIAPEKVADTLKEWMRVIKPKGYLVLYLPDEAEYPKVGESGANPDHKWNVSYDQLLEYMPSGFDLIDFQKRNRDKEYSLYFVFQKVGSGEHFSYRKPKPAKTCGIVRYGAFGDLIQASSVFAALKAEGYHVTLYTSPPGDEIVKFDPHIDEFYLQDKDQVPNGLLGEYWAYHKAKYDKWINLSESVEGSLLALPGRTMHFWPPALRHSMLNRNYLEIQHEIAGVKYAPKMHFYATESERQWARKERAKMGEFLIVWALAGSSIHKTWKYLDTAIAAIMLDFPTAQVVFVGGEAAKLLERGWEKEPRVHLRSGKWSIRESLAFMSEADMAIGPETGVMNAAAQLAYPKVVFLSHSTHENLTRDWTNVHPLSSENTTCPGRGKNEAPACHQLHYSMEHCQNDGDGLAQCMADISPDQAYRVIWHIITAELEKRKAA